MEERRKHSRLPVIKDFAEPIELAILKDHHIDKIPGVVTNLSAGGMDLVLMGQIDGAPKIKLSLRLSGFDRFEVEGRIVWTRPKGITSVVGIEFTKIDPKIQEKITHMAKVYWENEREKKAITN